MSFEIELPKTLAVSHPIEEIDELVRWLHRPCEGTGKVFLAKYYERANNLGFFQPNNQMMSSKDCKVTKGESLRCLIFCLLRPKFSLRMVWNICETHKSTNIRI